MKTTVEISDALFAEARREVERADVTLRELIEAGLRRVLEERKRLRGKPFKLRDASVGGKGLAPGYREGGRALLAYARMGTPGSPNTLAEVHAMLDGEDP